MNTSIQLQGINETAIMNHWKIYTDERPDIVFQLVNTPAMQRLADVGMNCGCEYTSFPLIQNIKPYSRLDHSIGAALIVWNFTHDTKQTVAALLHDIATPSFAHVIDFLHGDHEMQESTEDLTFNMIEDSVEIRDILKNNRLTIAEVSDYHLFAIADNPTPQLSADRLEYTIGNIINYGYMSEDKVKYLYDDLMVGVNEKNEQELVFKSESCAMDFSMAALRMSKIYIAPEDRYAMQRLAELLKEQIDRGIITERDLYGTETSLIEKLCADQQAHDSWLRFRAYKKLINDPDSSEARIVSAKKRYINPFVDGKGRLSELSPKFKYEMQQFLDISFEEKICAE